MVTAAEYDSRRQKEDVRNLFTFLDLKERIKDVTFSDGKNMFKNLKLKGGNAHGINAMVQVLCQGKKSKEFLGRTPEERALTRQWMEYNLSYLAGNILLTPSTLRELDTALAAATFFSGSCITVADFLIYFSLYSTFKQTSFYDKELYPNLCRWFRLIQEYEGIRGYRGKLVFSRSLLY